MTPNQTGTSELGRAARSFADSDGYHLVDHPPDGRRADAGAPALTSSRTAATAVALAATLGVAAAGWFVSIRQMNGMNLGVATGLGSLAFFVVLWVWMMAAMMLPGAIPAVVRRAQLSSHVLAMPLFVGSYLAVWTTVGLAVYGVYRPHGTVAAGVTVVGAGVYELTPLKQLFRRHCREGVPSGFEYGLYCVASSIGLMLMFVALGVMSVMWTGVIAALIATQKLLPPRAAVDVPLAVAIVGFGIFIIVAPSSAPGLMPAM